MARMVMLTSGILIQKHHRQVVWLEKTESTHEQSHWTPCTNMSYLHPIWVPGRWRTRSLGKEARGIWALPLTRDSVSHVLVHKTEFCLPREKRSATTIYAILMRPPAPIPETARAAMKKIMLGLQE